MHGWNVTFAVEFRLQGFLTERSEAFDEIHVAQQGPNCCPQAFWRQVFASQSIFTGAKARTLVRQQPHTVDDRRILIGVGVENEPEYWLDHLQ